MAAIYLVRHGQASFGAADYDQLSDLGAVQARRLGDALKPRLTAVDIAVCGTMRRHQQTAAVCLDAMGVASPILTDRGWDEYDHQEVLHAFEPRFRIPGALGADLAAAADPMRAFQEIFAPAVARWVSGAHDGDYRETWAAFRARVTEALVMLARSLGKRETALVFTSGGPISAISGDLLHVPPERHLELGWILANAGVTKVLCRGDALHLSTFNDHAHLEGAERLVTYR